MKKLTKEKTDKFDKILAKGKSPIEAQEKQMKKAERVELKSYAIKKKVKLNKRYVRN